MLLNDTKSYNIFFIRKNFSKKIFLNENFFGGTLHRDDAHSSDDIHFGLECDPKLFPHAGLNLQGEGPDFFSFATAVVDKYERLVFVYPDVSKRSALPSALFDKPARRYFNKPILPGKRGNARMIFF